MSLLGSRRGQSNLGLPLMILTFIVIGGFMYWLYVTAEPTQPAAVEIEEEEPETAAGSGSGTLVPVDSLKLSPEGYEGQLIRVEGIRVAQEMGNRTYYVDLPETPAQPASSFLVRLNDELAAAGTAAAMGTPLTMVGTLSVMNDSTVTEWQESGSIGEVDRMLAEVATHYLLVEEIENTSGSGSGAQADSAAAGA